MDTWILRVDPAGEPGESSVPSELDGVVEEILGDGPAKVSLLEKFELASSSGEWAKVDGRHARLEYRYSLDGDRIVAKIDIETTGGPSQLETTLSFEPGKYVILGRGGEGFPNDASNTSLYYVLRARQPNA
jgi:hypothetical protein